MNNNRYTLFCYTISLLISHSLAYSCASAPPITLRFIKKFLYREALFIIGDTLADVDDEDKITVYNGTIIARVHIPILSPLNYNVEINGHLYVDEDPEALMQQVLQRYPEMKDVAPMIKQFFKEFGSIEHIENGIKWQRTKEDLITIGESAHSSATFNTRLKAAFEQVDAELDRTLAYEDEQSTQP